MITAAVGTQQRRCFYSKDLIFVGGDIFHDGFHRAGEDAAEVVDGGGIEGLVSAQLVDGGAGDPVIFDQGIGGLRRIAQGIPKGSVGNDMTASSFRIPYILL